MFQVLVREKKRRAISPLFMALSAAAHVALFGGVMYAAAGEPEGPTEVVTDTFEIPQIPEKEIEKPTVEAQPEQPAEPAVEPVKGQTVVLQPPVEVPAQINPPSAAETPITPDMVTGIGREGDVIGTPDASPGPLTGSNDPPATAAEEFIPGIDAVEKMPALDRNGLARLMERYYPPMLRDSRMNGRVIVELVVDRDGRVRPESARVIEASHPAFAEATLRAAERFRFRPAEIGGMVVPVRVSIPIVWTAVD